MTECYECARLAELTAENSQLRVKVDELANGGDYVSREAYEDLRDEFVWETTFLHRVAKKCGTKDAPSLVAYVEQLEAKVDELEADVSQAVTHAPERVTNDGEMYDNREKLEADANGYVMSWWQSDWVDSFGHADSMKRDIMRLLDRQAAITANELAEQLEDAEYDCATCAAKNELQAKVDKMTERLESAHAKNRSLRAHIAKMQEGRHGWHVKYPELLKRSAELKARVDELERENAKLSSDEFYLRCTLVNINGEVIS